MTTLKDFWILEDRGLWEVFKTETEARAALKENPEARLVHLVQQSLFTQTYAEKLTKEVNYGKNKA